MDGQAYYDSRDRRDESQQAPTYHQQSQQQQPQQQQSSQQSPPHSASPFAFAPPPLSSAAGPNTQRPQPVHHQQSEPLPSVNYQPSYYNSRPAQPVHSSSFPASAPMGGYRSYSNESPVAPGRGSPGPAPLSRTTSMNFSSQAQGGGPVASQQSPSAYNAYGGNRSTSGAYPTHSPSNRPSPYPHGSYYGGHPQQHAYQSSAAPTSVDMPRSLSYPNYSQSSYPSYMPGQPAAYPSHHHQGGHPGLPPLMRHNTTSTIGEGVGNMDINRSSMGYSFANRLPLVDRPFKCDECVQSFNRNHDLKRHKRIHLQVKPFGCDKCGKTFSRKDALRRHWLVKGCRGEDGATAPILPLYPLNSQPPALSPPTPPHTTSPGEPNGNTPFSTGGLSFSHPSAPPPLGSLPPRQHNESTTTLLVTPNDVTSAPAGIVSLDEPASIHPGMGSSHRTSESSTEGYFEAAQGSIMMEKSRSSGSHHASPYQSRYPTAMHPYRRPSPQRTQTDSPSYVGAQQRMVSVTVGEPGKPQFAAPFNGHYDSNGGMLAPDASVKMEKQLSQMSQVSADGNEPQQWQRWHRPSFPFPPPSGINYNYQQPPSPVDMQPQQAYA